MLLHCAQPRVVEYLETVSADQVTTFADTLQLMVVELIRKVWHNKPDSRVHLRSPIPKRFLRSHRFGIPNAGQVPPMRVHHAQLLYPIGPVRECHHACEHDVWYVLLMIALYEYH